jgi:predicted nucleic acid-binding protein
MIAADSSSMVAYLRGESGVDVDMIGGALASGELVLPPVVVTELLSDPAASRALEADIPPLASLALTEGYWVRAAHARRALQQKRLKAKVADALITQFCIDHDVPLITRDRDFRHFAKLCGLRLA